MDTAQAELEQSEPNEKFLARMATTGKNYLKQGVRLSQIAAEHNIAGDGEGLQAYLEDPEVTQLNQDNNRLAVELTAGEERLLAQATPEALSQTVKELVRETSGGIAGLVVEALQFIPPNVARLVLGNEIKKYIMGQFGGKPQRVDSGVRIVAKLAAVHSVDTAPSPVQSPPA